MQIPASRDLMNNKMLDYAPIGRIYDPLLQLAQRVHRAIAGTNKFVWTDAKGHVFVTSAMPTGPIAPHAVVGTFGRATLRSEVESALRLALRERASSWIVDWQAQPLRLTRTDVGRRLSARRRRLGPPEKDRGVATALPQLFSVDDNPSMA